MSEITGLVPGPAWYTRVTMARETRRWRGKRMVVHYMVEESWPEPGFIPMDVYASVTPDIDMSQFGSITAGRFVILDDHGPVTDEQWDVLRAGGALLVGLDEVKAIPPERLRVGRPSAPIDQVYGMPIVEDPTVPQGEVYLHQSGHGMSCGSGYINFSTGKRYRCDCGADDQ